MSERFADAVRRAKSPGVDKESNGLPASGPFSLYIRAYWAGSPILDGQWRPPLVKRVQQAVNYGVRDVVPRCERGRYIERRLLAPRGHAWRGLTTSAPEDTTDVPRWQGHFRV